MSCVHCDYRGNRGPYPISIDLIRKSPFSKYYTNDFELIRIVQAKIQQYHQGKQILPEFQLHLKMMGLIPDRYGNYSRVGVYASTPPKTAYGHGITTPSQTYLR